MYRRLCMSKEERGQLLEQKQPPGYWVINLEELL